jgi:TPR repeat protein
MNLLGIKFAEGEGVSKNPQIAVKLFWESAMQGYTPAMANLGTLYEKGGAGRPDLRRAYAWLRAAAFFGVPKESRDSTMFRLGMLAERLGRRKIIAAERLASNIAARVIEACGCSPSEETELTSIRIT